MSDVGRRFGREWLHFESSKGSPSSFRAKIRDLKPKSVDYVHVVCMNKTRQVILTNQQIFKEEFGAKGGPRTVTEYIFHLRGY